MAKSKQKRAINESTFNLEKLTTQQMMDHLDFTIKMGLDRFNKDKALRSELEMLEYRAIKNELNFMQIHLRLEDSHNTSPVIPAEKAFYESFKKTFKTHRIKNMNPSNMFNNFRSMRPSDIATRVKDLNDALSTIERRFSNDQLDELDSEKVGTNASMSKESIEAQLLDLHKHLTDKKKDINIAFFGRRGTGKTVITKDRIKASGCKMILLNLSTFERPDFSGYAKVFNREEGENYVDFFQPEFFRLLIEGNEPVVLVLDEADKADESVLAPLLEVTQFRKINDRLLPNLITCVITGNLISEGGKKPAPPLLDRCEKYLCNATSKEWLEWACDAGGIHPAIVAFISEQPSYLIGEVDMEDNYSDGSPRGYERASEICHMGERFGMDPNLIQSKVAGCVGAEAGIKFKVYHQHFAEITPLAEKVMRGDATKADVKDFTPTKTYVLFCSVANRMARIMDEKSFKKNELDLIDNAAQFILDCSNKNMETSYNIIRSILGAQRVYSSSPKLTKHNMDPKTPLAKLVLAAKLISNTYVDRKEALNS